jgi:LPXTG-motif cell wall-anchored protein
VDGKELSVHDLKPGMKLQRTIVTTTTPAMVTSVRVIRGKVWHVNPPRYVILTMPDNTNKQYTIPEDQKFVIDGQTLTAFELKKGMNVVATVVTQVPHTLVTQQRSVAGTAGAKATPPATPPLEGALLIEDTSAPKQRAAAAPAPAPAEQASASEPAPKKLPKTGSVVPLVGLLGLFSLLLSFGVRMLRRS